MFSTDYRSRVVGRRPTVINFTTGSTVIGQPPGHHPPHRGHRAHKPLWERPKPERLGGPIGGVRNTDESRRARDQARDRQRAADERARRDRDERERKARQRREDEARQKRLDELGRQARRSEEERRRRRDAERRAAEQRHAAERRRAEEQARARQQREREAAARRGVAGWLRDRIAELLPAAASGWSASTRDAAVFRSVIAPSFERTQAPPTLVLPEEFRASALHVQHVSAANAVTKSPGAPPILPEVNRGIVIENGVLKAIPGNVGQASETAPSVPPVYASPGQEFIARIHVHPGRTPLDAGDVAYLWEPGRAPRMTGVVMGSELGVMISTRQSEQMRVNSPLPFALGNVTNKFQRVIDSVEQPALARLKDPTAAQKNEARHAALAALAQRFGFVYYRGALGAPMTRVDAARR